MNSGGPCRRPTHEAGYEVWADASVLAKDNWKRKRIGCIAPPLDACDLIAARFSNASAANSVEV